MLKSWINIAFLGIVLAPIGIFVLALITYLWDDFMNGVKPMKNRKIQEVYPYEELKNSTKTRKLRAIK